MKLVSKPADLSLYPRNEGRQLVTANHRSGTLTRIDLEGQKVVGETAVGKQLSDVVVTTDPQELLVTDEEANQLIAVHSCRRAARSQTPDRQPLSGERPNQCLAPAYSRLVSRTLTVVDGRLTSDVDRDSLPSARSDCHSPRGATGD